MKIIHITAGIQETHGMPQFVMEITRAHGVLLKKAGGICYNYTDAE